MTMRSIFISAIIFYGPDANDMELLETVVVWPSELARMKFSPTHAGDESTHLRHAVAW